MPGPAEVPAALRREVRHLSTLLGRVIEEAGGSDLLADVERLRRATIAVRRRPSEVRRRRLLKLVDAMPAERAEPVARAFTLYFQLVNLAEEHHRVRTLRERGRGEDLVDDSIEAAVRQVREAEGEDVLRRLVERLEIAPVLTAHPTEARRRAVVETLWRIAGLLERVDDPRSSRADTLATDRLLLEEITTLWHTDPLRPHAPDPLDEVRAAMAVFDQTIFVAVPGTYRELAEALGDGDEPSVRPFLRWGSWIGGDRDGNPSVTAEVTRATIEIQADHVLRGLEAATRRIARALSVSDRHSPPSDELLTTLAEDDQRLGRAASEVAAKFPEAAHRRKLSLAAHRLYATRIGHPDGYAGPEELLADLRLVQRSLEAAGADRVARGRLLHLIWQAETFGFHLASLEVRQHRDVHAATLDEVVPGIGRDAWALDRLAFGDGPVEARAAASATSAEVLDTLRAMSEIQGRSGTEACRRYVVSFTHDAADVVAVHALARIAVPDGSLRLDVVPLLESRDDLDRATEVLDELVALPGFAARLDAAGRRLEVMLGYSDSAKDVGVLAANFALYRAQAELAAWAEKQQVDLTLFHGRGGALGRGGGPANRAILGQAAGSVGGRFKITEQGEVTFARYGNLRLAGRHLEQVVNAVLVASTPGHERSAAEWWDRYGPVGLRAADASASAYRSLVETEGFAEFFARTTPTEEIGGLAIGSRPARRAGGEDLGDLRAIPWVFAWTQNRCNLPGWYGVGSGLAAIAEEPGGIDDLRAMHEGWAFFTSLIENVELSLAKADMVVARRYLALGDRPRLVEAIEQEFALTERMVLEITGHDRPLGGRPLLRRAIDLRNPYVDALSFLQARFLAERRAHRTDPEREALVDRIVKITINGLAAGLQNTG